MPIHDWKRVSAGSFHNLHLLWIGDLVRDLNGRVLPPGYSAMGEQVTSRPIPDVLTLRVPPSGSLARVPVGAAVAEVRPRARFVHSIEPEIYARKANRVVVRHRDGDVVAVIEIVSPGNKGSAAAIRDFVKKAVRFLDAGVSFLFVDLFRPTRRDPQGLHKRIWSEFDDEPFELPAEKPFTVASYEAGIERVAYVEPIGPGDDLPAMPLFLSPELYVPAPLESTYMSAWEACPSFVRDSLESPPQRPE